MKPLKLVAIAALLVAAPGRVAAGQDTASHQPFLKPPVFLVMPGGLTTCVISCPDVAPGVSSKSKTDFNARFQTVVPTATPWLAFVGGLQWGWAKADAHGPIGFFGGIIPLVPLNTATQGWLSFSLDPLGVVTGPGSKGTNFVGEGAVVLNIGAKMMAKAPVFKGLGAYFLLDQQFTNLPKDANGNTDRWNPALVWGALLQIAP